MVSAIAHSANVVDCLIWSAIALIVQIIVYFIVRIPVPNLSARIAAGELAPAIWLGLCLARRRRAQRRLDDLLTMADKPNKDFGKRRPVAVPAAAPPAKRSGHVALLLMGTLAVGGGAYALMPSENCEPTSRNGRAVAPADQHRMPVARIFVQRRPAARRRVVVAQQLLQQRFLVEPFVIGHVVRFRLAAMCTRGGFGAFAHAFSSHFSGGG